MDSLIAEKIRKLHALAERAGTEHEAALAASRVAALCRKHQLELGAVLVAEEIEASRCWITHKGSWRSYRRDLANAVCELLDLSWYRSRQGSYGLWSSRSFYGSWRIVFYGLKANIEAAEPTYRYFENTISEMLRNARKSGSVEKGARAARSFRVGCAERIFDQARRIAAESAEASCPEERELMRVGEALKKRLAQKLGLRPMRSSRWRYTTDDDAFYAGYVAAKKTNLRRAERLLE